MKKNNKPASKKNKNFSYNPTAPMADIRGVMLQPLLGTLNGKTSTKMSKLRLQHYFDDESDVLSRRITTTEMTQAQ